MNNFILEHMMTDLSICDELIEFHKMSPDKKRGTVYSSADGVLVNSTHKLSTDISLPDGPLSLKYILELQKCTIKYTEKYHYASCFGKWNIVEMMNIQHYAPGEAFYSWHTERNGNSIPETFRHLVFMTYLNDVDDGGETEFFHQNIKIKPQKGKTVIWPADWTHTHRGIPSPTQEKYIVTGWFSYC